MHIHDLKDAVYPTAAQCPMLEVEDGFAQKNRFRFRDGALAGKENVQAERAVTLEVRKVYLRAMCVYNFAIQLSDDDFLALEKVMVDLVPDLWRELEKVVSIRDMALLRRRCVDCTHREVDFGRVSWLGELSLSADHNSGREVRAASNQA